MMEYSKLVKLVDEFPAEKLRVAGYFLSAQFSAFIQNNHIEKIEPQWREVTGLKKIKLMVSPQAQFFRDNYWSLKKDPSNIKKALKSIMCPKLDVEIPDEVIDLQWLKKDKRDGTQSYIGYTPHIMETHKLHIENCVYPHFDWIASQFEEFNSAPKEFVRFYLLVLQNTIAMDYKFLKKEIYPLQTTPENVCYYLWVGWLFRFRKMKEYEVILGSDDEIKRLVELFPEPEDFRLKKVS